jgi:D-alanyl-D-alanine carboxypeptidase
LQRIKKFKMKRIIATITIAFIGLQTQAQNVPPVIKDSFQSILDKCVSASAPGGIMHVEKPGAWAHTWTSGVSDITNNQAIVGNEKFRIGSVSKNFLATAVLKLASTNALNLNDTIGKWLPTGITNLIPYASQINIRQLLLHTSGLADYLNNVNSGLLWNLLFVNRYEQYSFDTLMYNYYSTVSANNVAPNDSARYTNTGYLLLGEIVKQVSGLAYEQYLQQQIFTPLGLNNTSIPAANDTLMLAPYLHGYDSDTGTVLKDWTNQNMSWANAAGSIISTAQDLAKYFKALRAGSIIPLNWVDSMNNFQAVDADQGGTLINGYGIFKVEQGNYKFIGHTGSLPGYASYMFYLPKYDFYVTGNFNYTYGADNCVLANITDFMEKYVPATVNDNALSNKINAYPNPTTNNISFNVPGNTAVQLVDAVGKVIWQNNNPMQNEILQVSQFGSGLYHLIFMDKTTGQKVTEKISVQ